MIKQHLLLSLVKVTKLMKFAFSQIFSSKSCPQKGILSEFDVQFLRRIQVMKEGIGGKKLFGGKLVKHLFHYLYLVPAPRTTSPSLFLHFPSQSANLL
jgi:hypothetical protein